MSDARHEPADDGIGIFDLRFNPNFRKRFAGYDKRDVELYIRRQEAIMNKIRLEKEQLERQVIRLRQQLATSKEQLAEVKTEAETTEAETTEADTTEADAMSTPADPETADEAATEAAPDTGKITAAADTNDAEPEDAEPESEDAEMGART